MASNKVLGVAELSLRTIAISNGFHVANWLYRWK